MKNTSDKFSIKMRLKSIGFALAGFRAFIKEEHNARVHLAAASAVLIGAFTSVVVGMLVFVPKMIKMWA